MPVNRAGILLGRRVLAAVVVALAVALIGPPAAGAEQLFVDTTADEADAAPGSEGCRTAAGKCSLRAALEEANASAGEADEVRFEEAVFEDGDGPAIELGSALPTITDRLALSGLQCETGAGVRGPCVHIDGLDTVPALTVTSTAGVDIESLAITGAEVGVEAVEAESLRIRGSWFGVGPDGSVGGNGTAILLGPGSDGSRIGGEGPEAKNLIAASESIGLQIFGASKVRVLGNDFGVSPAGTGALANGLNLAIASSADSTAVDNTVGTRVSPAAAATAACDGGCNLISGSESSGIDLSGLGGTGPAVGTTIVGNHIGLDGAGNVAPNAGAGVLVGASSHTLIGGPGQADANLIAGGTHAVLAAPDGPLVAGAPFLIIRGNLIGSAASPDPAAIPDNGIEVDSGPESLSLPPEGAAIVDNVIGLDGGAGVSQRGLGATIAGNRVQGATEGIRVYGDGSASLIDGNSVEASEAVGIVIENSGNRVTANEVTQTMGTGIRVEGATLPFGISENVIGGDAPAAENRIDGSGGPAIAIRNTEDSSTEVARNRGSGNDGLFIDLLTAPEAEGGPNHGILPPAIATISSGGTTGFADPEAVVRVFRKASPSPGELESFLGQATADENGSWSLSFPTSLSPGAAIGATQTLAGGTSELEIASVPLADGQQSLQPILEGSLDRRRPRTRMLRQPKRVGRNVAARFAFTSNEPSSRFECSLDGAPFRSCTSPKRYRGLRPGKHLFRVRAIDAAGNADRTPLRRRFEVLA